MPPDNLARFPSYPLPISTVDEWLHADCCRWLGASMDESREFCGNRRIAGKSYCADHYALCVRPMPPYRFRKGDSL